MIENFVQEIEGNPKDPEPFRFATIGTVYTDGVTLIFPGEPESVKHYLVNQYCKFASGQRVAVQKDSGTYIVMFPVGAPAPVTADTATSANTANSIANQYTQYGGFTMRQSVAGNFQIRQANGAWYQISVTAV